MDFSGNSFDLEPALRQLDGISAFGDELQPFRLSQNQQQSLATTIGFPHWSTSPYDTWFHFDTEYYVIFAPLSTSEGRVTTAFSLDVWAVSKQQRTRLIHSRQHTQAVVLDLCTEPIQPGNGYRSAKYNEIHPPANGKYSTRLNNP